jgi:hypothetical protein
MTSTKRAWMSANVRHQLRRSGQKVKIPQDSYSAWAERFRQRRSSLYVMYYFEDTQALLRRAAALDVVPDQSLDIDQRFIDAGMLPYLDDLRKLVKRLPD